MRLAQHLQFAKCRDCENRESRELSMQNVSSTQNERGEWPSDGGRGAWPDYLPPVPFEKALAQSAFADAPFDQGKGDDGHRFALLSA